MDRPFETTVSDPFCPPCLIPDSRIHTYKHFLRRSQANHLPIHSRSSANFYLTKMTFCLSFFFSRWWLNRCSSHTLFRDAISDFCHLLCALHENNYKSDRGPTTFVIWTVRASCNELLMKVAGDIKISIRRALFLVTSFPSRGNQGTKGASGERHSLRHRWTGEI